MVRIAENMEQGKSLEGMGPIIDILVVRKVA